MQYYLFCEDLFKAAARSWCPSPEGYPQHCCYESALEQQYDGGPEVAAGNHLLQVYPQTPVFANTKGGPKADDSMK